MHFDGEELLGCARKSGRVEALKAVHDAMGGQNDQPVGVHIDEGHHDGRFRISRGGAIRLVLCSARASDEGACSRE